MLLLPLLLLFPLLLPLLRLLVLLPLFLPPLIVIRSLLKTLRQQSDEVKLRPLLPLVFLPPLPLQLPLCLPLSLLLHGPALLLEVPVVALLLLPHLREIRWQCW